MKRILSFICLFAMVISMAACKPEAEHEGESSSEPKTEQVTSGSSEYDESSESPGSTDEPESTETPDEIPVTETVYFSVPAIKAENGNKIDLSIFNVQISKALTTPAAEITWSSDELEITDGKYVTAPRSGVYKLTAKSTSGEKSIYVVSKAADENEYVLYSNEFDDSGMSGLSIIQKTSATVYVSNGKLVLDASSSTSSYARVLLPAFLGDFGDYKITTVGTIKSAKNTKRWTSVMFRVQSNDYPYYQQAIRQDATLTNGVELAERTAANAWNVRHTNAFSDKISESKQYTFTVDVHGNYAAAYINGNLITEGTDFDAYRTGRIGLQANGCKGEYESIRIVLSDSEPLPYPTELANVQEIETNIINSAAVINEIKTYASYNKITEANATTILLHVDSSLNVTDESGNAIAKLSDVMEKIQSKYIVSIYPENRSALTEIIKYISANNLTDVAVMSDKAEYLAEVYKSLPKTTRILDLRATKPDASSINAQLSTIRETTNASYARICVLSADFANKRYVEYLNRRATTVWIDCSGDEQISAVNCITSGANGIVSVNPDIIASAMRSECFKENSILRPVQVIGHRGIPSVAPENTIEGSALAVSKGATIVENDVYLTKDGVLVVMHDSTIDRTTNGTGTVTSMTYEEISKYYVDTHAGIQAKIPTLEDYFKEFKGKDVVIYIEIKDSNPKIVPAIKSLIEKYDILDQCAIISFHTDLFTAIREQIPGISCGYLTSSITSPEILLPDIVSKDSTFNPNNSNLSAELARKLMLRGVSIWPWTVNNKAVFDNCFMAGYSGITTNYSNYASSYLKYLDTDKTEYVFKAGESAEISVTTENYLRETINSVSSELVIVSGNDTVKYENGKLTATSSGTAYVMFRSAYKLNNGQTAYIYTQIITVNVQ